MTVFLSWMEFAFKQYIFLRRATSLIPFLLTAFTVSLDVVTQLDQKYSNEIQQTNKWGELSSVWENSSLGVFWFVFHTVIIFNTNKITWQNLSLYKIPKVSKVIKAVDTCFSVFLQIKVSWMCTEIYSWGQGASNI